MSQLSELFNNYVVLSVLYFMVLHESAPLLMKITYQEELAVTGAFLEKSSQILIEAVILNHRSGLTVLVVLDFQRLFRAKIIFARKCFLCFFFL